MVTNGIALVFGWGIGPEEIGLKSRKHCDADPAAGVTGRDVGMCVREDVIERGKMSDSVGFDPGTIPIALHEEIFSFATTLHPLPPFTLHPSPFTPSTTLHPLTPVV